MRYHNITKEDMLNGDGLRVVLWVAGCSHGCKGCQNPITWDPKGGLEFDETAKEEIYEQMGKSYVAGITFSGGDPLYRGNRLEVTAFAKELKEKYPKKTIWLYTGYLRGRNTGFGDSDLFGGCGSGKIYSGQRDVSLKGREAQTREC